MGDGRWAMGDKVKGQWVKEFPEKQPKWLRIPWLLSGVNHQPFTIFDPG